MLQCNTDATKCNGEIEKEIEIEIELEKEGERKTMQHPTPIFLEYIKNVKLSDKSMEVLKIS